ncbi:glycoside hydrolase family 25 protein [Streptomyces sp. NPDC006184]|uniref:glycoside hydrolase family 25 protein n=1 Tax=Streptomyces sp. NPDC006184 TaxID=3155455 RepID=UPI0033A9DC27
MIKGYDVSAFQQANFPTAGTSFVFIKGTEGRSYVNPKQKKQAAHARAAALVVGFYHFLHPGNIKEQAAHFVEGSASTEYDLLVADWEINPDGTAATCTEKDSFIAEVKRLRGSKHKIGLYCNRDFWRHRDTTGDAGDFLWIAQYGVSAGKPDIQTEWMFHQHTDKPLDTNVGNFTSKAELVAFAGGVHAETN